MRDDMRLKLVIVVFVVSCSSIITRLASAAVQNEECRVGRCGHTEIKFPFHLKVDDEDEDDKCVFPAGFQLTCVDHTIDYVPIEDSTPMVEFEYQVNTSIPGIYLSLSVQASVLSIDYMSHQLRFKSEKQNFTQQQYDFSHNSTSTSPFTASTLSRSEFYDQAIDDGDYTFYNCSASINNYHKDTVHSLSNNQYRVVFLHTSSDIADAFLLLCKKMYTISDVPYTEGFLTWSLPDCGDCETNKQYCKFKPNTTTTVAECYGQRPVTGSADKRSADKLLLAGKIGGICFMVLALVALCHALKSYKQMKKHQSKIEMFLAEYKALKPSRYSYADIKKITNQFKVKLGEGGFGTVFKGQLSNDIVVAVKVLNDRVDAKGSGEDFVNEVGTIGLIHHVNVVRLVGYCADGCNRALVYEFLPNNSLDKYAYSRNKQNKDFVGWEKMKDIAMGIAKGIEYLHQDCSQQILHFDIKPNNILLDQNFNPKIADFGLAKLCTKGESMVSMTARGTIGYIAPEVFSRNFGKVSSKSDIYSFGMLLLETVGAKDHTSVGSENTSQVYFPEWVFHQLERGSETRIEIVEGVDNNIARKLTIVGLWCISWHPADRPSMKRVIQMLQEEDCPAIPPNPFNSATSRNATAFGNSLEVISESD